MKGPWGKDSRGHAQYKNIGRGNRKKMNVYRTRPNYPASVKKVETTRANQNMLIKRQNKL